MSYSEETVSEKYKKLLEIEHQNSKWGGTVSHHITRIKNTITIIQPKTILDYGAGRGTLSTCLPDRIITQYEPGIKHLSVTPDPHDFVVCVDVLEHVEPDLIDKVLEDLRRVTLKTGFFTISTRLASRILTDGRNAHLIVEPWSWWKIKIQEKFDITWSSINEAKFDKKTNPLGDTIILLVSPK